MWAVVLGIGPNLLSAGEPTQSTPAPVLWTMAPVSPCLAAWRWSPMRPKGSGYHRVQPTLQGSKGGIRAPNRGIWCCVRCSGVSGQTMGLPGPTGHGACWKSSWRPAGVLLGTWVAPGTYLPKIYLQIAAGWGSGGWGQTLFSGAQRQDKGQWAQTEVEEVPSEHEEELLPSEGDGCPGGLWSLPVWRYSRPAWTRSCAACCRWPCFVKGVGLDDPQRSLPTPNILCDSVCVCELTPGSINCSPDTYTECEVICSDLEISDV